VEGAGVPVIEKPFTAAVFEEAVTRVLNAGRAPSA
jgi:hypothetical protein